jgi:hypothetical protein
MFADKYPPTFKAKIPYDSSEDKFDFDSYDMDNNEIDFKDYVSNLKGGKAQFIIQLNGIWFSAGMFGCSWKIVSAKFQKVNSSKITFVKDSDDDNVEEDDEDDIEVDTEVISKSVQKPQVTASATTVSKTPVVSSKKEEEDEDEDDEEEEDEEEDDEEEVEDAQVPEPEPEPEPVKPAVKKVNKKK